MEAQSRIDGCPSASQRDQDIVVPGIDRSKVAAVFCAKLASEDPMEEYTITPSEDDDWGDAVREARGHGIPIACFGDTSDKLVLHAGHLGHEFDYPWGREYWTDEAGWDDKVPKETKRTAMYELLLLARFLAPTFPVKVLRVRGTGKGYLSYKNCLSPLEAIGPDGEMKKVYSESVLFVYGLTYAFMRDFIKSQEAVSDQ